MARPARRPRRPAGLPRLGRVQAGEGIRPKAIEDAAARPRPRGDGRTPSPGGPPGRPARPATRPVRRRWRRPPGPGREVSSTARVTPAARQPAPGARQAGRRRPGLSWLPRVHDQAVAEGRGVDARNCSYSSRVPDCGEVAFDHHGVGARAAISADGGLVHHERVGGSPGSARRTGPEVEASDHAAVRSRRSARR